jgi:hypothetical protein
VTTETAGSASRASDLTATTATAKVVYQASDLNRHGRAILDTARRSEARIRDTNGTSLLVLDEGRVQVAMALLQVASNFVTLCEAMNVPERSPLTYGDWTWLRHVDEDDRHEFKNEMQHLLALGLRERSQAALDTVGQALDAWRATAEALADPQRRGVLLGPHRDDDFLEVSRPEASGAVPGVQGQGESLPVNQEDSEELLEQMAQARTVALREAYDALADEALSHETGPAVDGAPSGWAKAELALSDLIDEAATAEDVSEGSPKKIARARTVALREAYDTAVNPLFIDTAKAALANLIEQAAATERGLKLLVMLRRLPAAELYLRSSREIMEPAVGGEDDGRSTSDASA